jgi:hypothetical protein
MRKRLGRLGCPFARGEDGQNRVHHEAAQSMAGREIGRGDRKKQLRDGKIEAAWSVNLAPVYVFVCIATSRQQLDTAPCR